MRGKARRLWQGRGRAREGEGNVKKRGKKTRERYEGRMERKGRDKGRECDGEEGEGQG